MDNNETFMPDQTIDPELISDVLSLQRVAMQLSLASRRRLAIEIEGFGLTVPQFIALRALSNAPEGLTMSELAEASQQLSATMTGIIDRLVERNIVQRQRNPDDRRSLRISLSESGKHLIQQIEDQQIKRMTRVFRLLSAFERKEMLRLLTLYLETTLAELPESQPVHP